MDKSSAGKNRAASAALRSALKSFMTNRGTKALVAGGGAGVLAYQEQELANKGIASLLTDKNEIHHSTPYSKYLVPLAVGATVAKQVAHGTYNPKGGGPAQTGFRALKGMNPRTMAALPLMPLVSGGISSISTMTHDPDKPVNPDSRGVLGDPLQKLHDVHKAVMDPASAISMDKIPKEKREQSHADLKDWMQRRWDKSLQSVVGATAGLGIAELLPYLTKYKTDERNMSAEQYDEYRKKRRKQEALYHRMRILLPILGYAAPYGKEIWQGGKDLYQSIKNPAPPAPAFSPSSAASILSKEQATAAAKANYEENMRNAARTKKESGIKLRLPKGFIPTKGQAAKKLMLGTGGYLFGKGVQDSLTGRLSGEGPTTSGRMWLPPMGNMEQRELPIDMKGSEQIAPLLSALAWMSLGDKNKAMYASRSGAAGRGNTRIKGMSSEFMPTFRRLALPGLLGTMGATAYNVGAKPGVGANGEVLPPLIGGVGEAVGDMKYVAQNPTEYRDAMKGPVLKKTVSELWNEYKPDISEFTKNKLIPGAVGSTLAYYLASRLMPNTKKPLRKVRNAERAYRRETAERASRRMALGIATAVGAIGAPAAYEAIAKALAKHRASA